MTPSVAARWAAVLLGILVFSAIVAPHAAGRLVIAAMLVLAALGCAFVALSINARFHRLHTDSFAPEPASLAQFDQPELLARLRSVSGVAHRTPTWELGGVAAQVIRAEVAHCLVERYSLSLAAADHLPQISRLLSPKLFLLSCGADVPAGYGHVKPATYLDLPALLDEVDHLSR